jgi:hypothetical protein
MDSEVVEKRVNRRRHGTVLAIGIVEDRKRELLAVRPGDGYMQNELSSN